MTKELFAAAAVAVLMGGMAQAATFIIAEETWDAGASWMISDDSGGAANGGITDPEGAFGNPGGSLLIENDSGVVPEIDRIFANLGSSGGAFVGDYTDSPGTQFISFDFFNYTDVSPAGLQLFFTSSSSPGATWYYDMGAPLSGPGWHPFTVEMSQTGWSDFGSGGTWASDIVDVDEIGIRLTYLLNAAGQNYFVDNFRRGYETLDASAVPEPGTYAALSMALISIGATFRRRVEGSVQGLIHRLRA